MWVIAEYEATSLFSLKPATATASGGRTLLVPTPFAIKMALLDVACRLEGVEKAKEHWAWLNPCTVALRGADDVVVNNTFIKILKPRNAPASEGSVDRGPLQRTISYREFAYLDGTFEIALQVDDDHAELLSHWLMHVNYLGKRGGFIQIQGEPIEADDLDQEFIVVDGRAFDDGFVMNALLTQLDDTGEKTTFEYVDIYSGKNIKLGTHRILHHVALPYTLAKSSRHYSYYRRNDATD